VDSFLTSKITLDEQSFPHEQTERVIYGKNVSKTRTVKKSIEIYSPAHVSSTSFERVAAEN